MWNKSIALPKTRITATDAAGFPSSDWDFTEHIPANFKDVTRADETLAHECGYTADVVVEIVGENYNRASFFVDEATGEIYDIRRTYRPDRSMTVQLTGERRERGKV